VIRAAENDIRGNQFETFVAVDGNGEEVYRKVGGRGSVLFSDAEIEVLQSARPPVFTHNHPSSSSFSFEDVAFASRIGSGEVRVAVGGGAFVMRGIPSEDETREFLTEAMAIDFQQRAEWQPRVNSGELSIPVANRTHKDEVWKKVTSLPRWRDIGIIYGFEPEK
jgi:hypothetical protein